MKNQKLDLIYRQIIEQMVQLIFDSFKIDENKEVDVFDIAKKCGFVFAEIDDKYIDDYKGILLLNPNEEFKGFGSKKIIGLNKQLSNEENRRIVAHELGHYFLKYRQGKLECCYKYVDNLKEQNSLDELEANYFAACLLLPKQSILRIVRSGSAVNRDNNLIVKEIVNLYNVESRCVERRLEEVKEF